MKRQAVQNDKAEETSRNVKRLYLADMREGGGITELNLVISTGKGGKRMHAQDSVLDKRNKIIAQCKSTLDRMSSGLSFEEQLLNTDGS